MNTRLNFTKNLLKALFLSGTMFFSNCNNDDKETTIAQEQDPLAGFIKSTGLDYIINPKYAPTNSFAFREIGYQFKTTKNGVIKAFTAKTPANQTSLRITLWNVETETILATETVSLIDGIDLRKDITPIPITKGVEYAISFNTEDYYRYFKENSANITFPIQVGDISITKAGFSGGSQQRLLNTFPTDHFSGNVSFIFQ
jgi:hypothetical protein